MAKRKKRADGRMRKTFTYEGKKYYIYGYDRKELEEKEFVKRKQLAEHKENHDNPKLDIFYERWTENRFDSIKESTLRCQYMQYHTCADIKINGKRLGDYRLAEIKVDDLRQLQKHLLEKNKTQTVNDKINVLNHILSDATKERYIEFNPCTLLKPLKRTEEKARDTVHRALSIEEQKLFFEEAKNSFYYDVFRFAVLTGMRCGEIGALYNSDIVAGMIHVKRTITKNSNGGYIIGEDAKTTSGIRNIPTNDAIIEVLEHQKRINRILDGDKIKAMHETIFKAPQRGLLMATPADREIKRICKRIGIPPFTMHALRATFATRAIETGIDPKTLQELLGHKDYGITMNLYGHVLNDTKQKAMDNLKMIL